MIHQVMIISSGGLCVVSHDYKVIQIDPQLVAGFLSALNNFSKHLTSISQYIESLQLTHLKMRLDSFMEDRLFVVLFHNKYDNPDIIEEVIFELENKFIDMFGVVKENFAIDLNRFLPFEQICQEKCRIRVDIALIMQNDPRKGEIWRYIRTLLGKNEILIPNQENEEIKKRNSFESLTTFQIAIETLDATENWVWGFDLPAIQANLHQLQNKNLLFFVIFPGWKKIVEISEIIRRIKEDYPQKPIYGLMIDLDNDIFRKNCEILLNIPIFPLILEDIWSEQKIMRLFKDAVIGGSELDER